MMLFVRYMPANKRHITNGQQELTRILEGCNPGNTNGGSLQIP